MPTLGRQRTRRLALMALFVVAVGVAGFVVLPVRTGQVGYDSAASVLYFDRLLAGRHLETFVSATPKPLLTLVYGAAFQLTNDWRVISWLAVAAFGLSVVLATILAERVGGLAAAGFASVAFLLSSTLLRDVALAYALVWALLGWLGAGLALTCTPPRYGLAGLALLLAATARFESLVLSLVAVLAVATWWALARTGRLAPPPRAAWLLAIGLIALPIQMGHDVLLTGDPWFSQKIAPLVTADYQIIGVVERARWLIDRYLAYGLTLGVAVLGIAWLVARRRIDLLVGLAALGPGIAVLLLVLEARHIYVSIRYAGAIDLAVLFAASIGMRLVAIAFVPMVIDRIRGSFRAAFAIAAGGVAGLLVAAQLAAAAPDVFDTARSDLTLHANADASLPIIAAELERVPGVHEVLADRPGSAGEAPTKPTLLVPLLLRPQFALDLDIPLTAIDRLTAAKVAELRPGQIVFHDRRADEDDPALSVLELDAPTTVGDVTLTPVASNPRRGWWVVRVDAAGD